MIHFPSPTFQLDSSIRDSVGNRRKRCLLFILTFTKMQVRLYWSCTGTTATRGFASPIPGVVILPLPPAFDLQTLLFFSSILYFLLFLCYGDVMIVLNYLHWPDATIMLSWKIHLLKKICT